MLELMIQKKMNERKKNIIKIYGKDMLAEMYLDLLNITDGDTITKRMLSPLSKRLPKVNIKRKQKKHQWNFDQTITYENNRTFKLNSTSIFNSPNDRKYFKGKENSSRNKKRIINKKAENLTQHNELTNIETKVDQNTIPQINEK